MLFFSDLWWEEQRRKCSMQWGKSEAEKEGLGKRRREEGKILQSKIMPSHILLHPQIAFI